VQLEAVRSLRQVDPEKAQKLLDETDGTIRRGLTESRRALQALRASPLQEGGLVVALQHLAETAAERCGTSLALRLPAYTDQDLPANVEQGVYRIAQEALENVVRHAEATAIVVELGLDDHELALVVQDDGQGIAGNTLAASSREDLYHLGIRGMEERASMIGGHLEISSEEGSGTAVRLTVPLRP